MDIKKQNRIYFLQDLKNVLEKHNALLEIDLDYYGQVDFLYDLRNDESDLNQVGNQIGTTGEFDSGDIQCVIDKELNKS